MLCALLWTAPSLALRGDLLPTQHLTDRFARASGLPSEAVWLARQGPSGYLWLGTTNGLVRFDGISFKTFNTQTERAFRSNDIRVLTWADNGTLWLGTYGGGALFRTPQGWQALGVNEGLASDTVYDIHIDEDDSVWFATGGGVSRYRDGHIDSWTVDDGLADQRVFKIAPGEDGSLWFSTLTNGLSRFDGSAFTSFSGEPWLEAPQVHLLSRDPALGLLAGTITGAIYRLDSGQPVPLQPSPLQQALPFEEALRDRDGNLWLGTYGKGLWRLSKDGEWLEFPLDEGSSGYVFDLFEDGEGNIWASTMAGLYRLRDSGFLPFGRPEGMADSTFVVTGTPTGIVYAGTETGGLYRIDNDEITAIDESDGLASQSVSSLLVADDETLWVGTFGGGISRFAKDGVSQLGMQQGLNSDHIIALEQDSDGNIWIATARGLYRLQDEELERIPLGEETTDNMVRHIMQDSRGRLWFSTNNGLLRREGDSSRWYREADGLASNLISGTYEDADGVIWIASREGGLAQLDNGRIFQFTLEQGVPQLSALAILEDSAQRLWLSGSGGLARIARSALNAVASGEAKRFSAQLFDEADGLRSAQFMGGFQPAAFKAGNGHLWFPTNRGLVSIDPTTPSRQPPPLRPIIEAIRIDGAAVPLTDTVELPADTRTLEIDYTAPYLGNAAAIVFRYQLEGADSSWQAAGTRRTAYFTSVPPGESVFSVEASREGGREGFTASEAARLSLNRNLLWYQTGWALVLFCIAIVGLLFGIYRFTAHKTRQRERQLETLVNQRTEELQAALSTVEQLSRTDGLTGVANRRYFEERLEGAWTQALRSGESLGIIMLDIDRFKQYNDAAGHQAGDDCLKKIAAALQHGTLRDGDMVARYGGEEFIILLHGAGHEAATQIALRIMERVRALKLRHPDSDISPYVSVSLGCATATTDALSGAAELMERADQALYRAKNAGRDQIRIYEGRTPA
ncbi:ligand-binding sensor domain-containing diguanylate cyclase [Chromatocurvus halotolerans]|uniref:diguanylate cyclase n=1 Tax=Chromatocurvus halotolerans TaxID=1132028 RepID=A0A4R2KWA8_9GAMM|nr:ligand-binding sensor domain-containing diguanylate cyclase [Chromatocurvus halotolerans]TCO74518.1 diguanylate cyclase (GGDEF)-like protein [Chromatocurvus halotolerans]